MLKWCKDLVVSRKLPIFASELENNKFNHLKNQNYGKSLFS